MKTFIILGSILSLLLFAAPAFAADKGSTQPLKAQKQLEQRNAGIKAAEEKVKKEKKETKQAKPQPKKDAAVREIQKEEQKEMPKADELRLVGSSAKRMREEMIKQANNDFLSATKNAAAELKATLEKARAENSKEAALSARESFKQAMQKARDDHKAALTAARQEAKKTE